MSDKTIKTIIFDIGNVLVDFCWEEYCRSFGFTEEEYQRVCKAIMLSNAWDEFDRGALADDQIIQMFVDNDAEMEEQIRKVCFNIKDMLRKRDYAIPWIKELKGMGYKVLFLSNFSRKAEIECAHTLDFVPYMDGGIFSYEVKLIKPEPQIYKTLLTRYDLDAESCVFLDDREDNVLAARELGIHGIVFTTKEDAMEQLRELGVY